MGILDLEFTQIFLRDPVIKEGKKINISPPNEGRYKSKRNVGEQPIT